METSISETRSPGLSTAEDEASGDFVCESNGLEVHVFLQAGRVAWASDSQHPRAFLRYLREQEKIDDDGLKRAGRNLTTDSLIAAPESVKGLDSGIGAVLSFGPSEHQGSHKVWGTRLDKSCIYRVFDLD